MDKDENDNLRTNKENEIKVNKKFELRPVPTIYSTVTCFIFFGLLFLALGVILLIVSSFVKEFSIQYDNVAQCYEILHPTNTTNATLIAELNNILNINNGLKVNQCKIQFTLFEKFPAPIMVYYELDNFYQNHRKFIKSVSIEQLAGQVFNTSSLSDCDPITSVADLGINKTFGGYYLPQSAPANPCGLYARAFFNDTYSLSSINDGRIIINETNIAWPTDKEFRFKSPLNAERIQWINVTDEHFMVWMRPAATNNFRKLWGRIEADLQPGNYSLIITNNYDVSYFQGSKKFVISTTSIFGGKNSFLGTLYIVMGAVCLLSAALFAIAYSNKILEEKKKIL